MKINNLIAGIQEKHHLNQILADTQMSLESLQDIQTTLRLCLEILEGNDDETDNAHDDEIDNASDDETDNAHDDEIDNASDEIKLKRVKALLSYIESFLGKDIDILNHGFRIFDELVDALTKNH